MRNLLLVSFVFLFSSPLLFSQMPQIQSINGNEFCCSQGETSYAYFEITSPPGTPLPSNATMTYTWKAWHENGTLWTWYSSVPYRVIPIYWEGEYTVRVTINYVQKHQNNAFAAFSSNEFKIFGKQCILPPGTPEERN